MTVAITRRARGLLRLLPSPAVRAGPSGEDGVVVTLMAISEAPQRVWVDKVRRHVGEREVAARRHRVKQPGHDRVRLVGVGDRVHDRDQRDRHRPGEVKQFAGLLQDRGGVAQVRLDVVCRPRLSAAEQGPGVRQHGRVVVHVHHPGLRGDCLGHLVYVACRRDTGPDVKELAYPRLGSEEADGAAEERPVRPRREGQLRVDLERLLHRRPVSGVVVLAAEQVVVYAGLIRLRGVKRQRPGLASALCRCLIDGHLGSPVGIGPRAIPAFHYCQHRNADLIPAAQPALRSE